MSILWSGTAGVGQFNREHLNELVSESLSRAQLRDLIRIRECNPGFDFAKLIALVTLHDRCYPMSELLAKYGLCDPGNAPAVEDARYARMSREDLVSLVRNFIQ